MKEANGFGLSSSLKALKKSPHNSGYKNAVTEAKAMLISKKKYVFKESKLNNGGYKLMPHKHIPDALAIFKLNVFLCPNSAYAFDSLA